MTSKLKNFPDIICNYDGNFQTYMPVKAMLDSYPITNVVLTEVSSLGIGIIFNSV